MSVSARSAEPRHRGGAGCAAQADTSLPRWHSQKVKVPRRVWGDRARYSPGAVAWHAQITALQARPERCRASVARLAEWMGDSKRTGERYLRELAVPGPDGVAELTVVRHTSAAGDGETAERWTRRPGRDEHFALVPIGAAKSLRHPLFVLYCALTYSCATHTPVTAAELGGVLGVTEMTARRMTTELERLGWITVDRRAGAHGRHEYEVHDHPLHPAPTTPEAVSSDGGSGASADGGSLATEEDAGLTDVEKEPPTPVLGIRRRRPTATSARARDLMVDTFGRRTGLDLTPAAWHTVHHVLDPVRHRLPELTAWEWERLVGDVLAQLADGQTPGRLHQRLQRRYAVMWTPTTEDTPDDGQGIRSIARWLIGPALARHGCERPDCETGVIWPDGTDCPTCALRHEPPAPTPQPTTAPHPHPHAPPRPRPAPVPPPLPPDAQIGPPPEPGGWRALVARERPHDLRTFRARWTGHQHLLPPDTPTGT
ncbi:helix-turn-helix domain-containing protein [Streptomyces acidiscabies]|uniref:Helix-turn-helix domain-containing protein n=1 Tax=Streptomyces acidiscabies TaxID=42234 RepID=A0ABU4M826_9ACTN|nr:hypothetical protein [Streptomyces acidiscabies]MDX3024048.1 hypothetical protein [Streptomyces acidiscabies]